MPIPRWRPPQTGWAEHLSRVAILLASVAVAGTAWAEPTVTQPGEPGETPRRLTAEVVERLTAETAVPLADDPDATVRWLPETVRGVKTGPDGRQWYALYPDGWVPDAADPPDVEAIKRVIEGQFTADAPKLPGARVALFEPEGRVWFIEESERMLLGYAGVPGEWIERPASKRWHRYIGAPSGKANPDPEGLGRNHVVGRYRLFIDNIGVQVFDGESWSRQAFTGEAKDEWDYLEFRTAEADPNGGVVFLIEEEDCPLWRFYEGEWTELPQTQAPAENLRLAVGLADGRVLVYALNHGIEFLEIPVDKAATQPAADDGEADPPAAAPAVDLTDPAIQRQTDAAALTPDGTILISGADKTPDDAGTHGLVVLDPQRPLAEARLIGGLDIAANLHFLADPAMGAAWITPSRLYLPGGSYRPPGVLHLTPDGPLFTPLPVTGSEYLQTVADDGTLFIGGTYGREQSNAPIAAVPSDPPVQDAEAFVVTKDSRMSQGLMPDGRLWAVRERGDVSVFDGRTWQPLGVNLEPGQGKMVDLLPGAGGVMLATVSGREFDRDWNPKHVDYGLIINGQITLEEDLRLLVADHADVLRKAFGSGGVIRTETGFPNGPGGFGLLTDDADRLWLVQKGGVDVLVEGEWHRVLDGEVGAAAMLGDGGGVVLVHRNSAPRIARWRGGAVEVEEVEAGGIHGFVGDDKMRRGPDGAVWLGYSKREKNDVGGWTNHAVRLDPGGGVDVLADVGWPRLIEADGTVWLGGVGRHRDDPDGDRFAVWRDGEIVQHLRVPRANSTSKFLKVRPGSVWVWSETGLRHLVADDPDAPGHYRAGRVVVPQVGGQAVRPEFRRVPPVFEASPLGFIATLEHRATSPSDASEARLVIVRLFERGGADGGAAE